MAHNQITVGVLAAFIACIGRFTRGWTLHEPHRLGDAKAAAGAKRIFDILDHA